MTYRSEALGHESCIDYILVSDAQDVLAFMVDALEELGLHPLRYLVTYPLELEHSVPKLQPPICPPSYMLRISGTYFLHFQLPCTTSI